MSTEHLSTPARQARLEQVEALLDALRGGEVDAIVGESQVLLLRHVQHTEAALHTSAAQFRALVEVSAQIVWSTDVDGAVVDDSPSWRAFTGQTYEEWQGWGWLDALHPEDRARTAALWRQAVADQTPVSTEYRLRHVSGAWHWTAVRAVPLLTPDGAVHGWVGMNTDITVQKQAEEALRESEAYFREMTQNLPLVVWTNLPDGRVDFVNDRWLELTAQTLDYVCSHPEAWMSALHPEDRERAGGIYLDGTRAGTGFTMEARLRRASDGAYRWYLNRSVPLRDAAGNVVKFIGTCTDVHEQKQAAETRERLAAIVDSSDDAIIGQTLEGVITSWNRSAERLYGYTAAEAIGQPIGLLVPRDVPDEIPQILARLQQGERVDHYETQRVRKDGTRLDVSLTLSPIRDSTGRVIGASKIARDITARKRADAALQQAHATLEQRVEERTALLALIQDVTRAANEASRSAVALQYALDRFCAYTGWPVGHVYLAVAPGGPTAGRRRPSGTSTPPSAARPSSKPLRGWSLPPARA
jgi:PAS domain S-box-containing protein